jgi:competence ComEA-like helix-hairpin-helix protein
MYARGMRLIALVVAVLLAIGCDSRPQPTRNLNAATVAELEALPGIGPKRARSIIASRNARGGQFTSFDEILKIDGIGPDTVDQLKARFVLGPPRP